MLRNRAALATAQAAPSGALSPVEAARPAAKPRPSSATLISRMMYGLPALITLLAIGAFTVKREGPGVGSGPAINSCLHRHLCGGGAAG